MARTLTTIKEEYRDYYVTIAVTSTKFADERDTVVAEVKVWNGHPPTGMLSVPSLTGDVVKEFKGRVSRIDGQDEIEVLVVEAKEHIDKQKINEHAARESAKIAAERQFNEEE